MLAVAAPSDFAPLGPVGIEPQTRPCDTRDNLATPIAVARAHGQRDVRDNANRPRPGVTTGNEALVPRHTHKARDPCVRAARLRRSAVTLWAFCVDGHPCESSLDSETEVVDVDRGI